MTQVLSIHVAEGQVLHAKGRGRCGWQLQPLLPTLSNSTLAPNLHPAASGRQSPAVMGPPFLEGTRAHPPWSLPLEQPPQESHPHLGGLANPQSSQRLSAALTCWCLWHLLSCGSVIQSRGQQNSWTGEQMLSALPEAAEPAVDPTLHDAAWSGTAVTSPASLLVKQNPSPTPPTRTS